MTNGFGLERTATTTNVTEGDRNGLIQFCHGNVTSDCRWCRLRRCRCREKSANTQVNLANKQCKVSQKIRLTSGCCQWQKGWCPDCPEGGGPSGRGGRQGQQRRRRQAPPRPWAGPMWVLRTVSDGVLRRPPPEIHCPKLSSPTREPVSCNRGLKRAEGGGGMGCLYLLLVLPCCFCGIA